MAVTSVSYKRNTTILTCTSFAAHKRLSPRKTTAVGVSEGVVEPRRCFFNYSLRGAFADVDRNCCADLVQLSDQRCLFRVFYRLF